MINTIMTFCAEKIIDYLWPIGGASAAGVVKINIGSHFLLWMNAVQWLETLIIITFGAVIGWSVKRLLDMCFPKKRKKL